jgi:hypothetical protein
MVTGQVRGGIYAADGYDAIVPLFSGTQNLKGFVILELVGHDGRLGCRYVLYTVPMVLTLLLQTLNRPMIVL